VPWPPSREAALHRYGRDQATFLYAKTAVTTLRSATRLRFNSSGWGPAQLQRFIGLWLPDCERLETISFASNPIGPEGAAMLCDSLRLGHCPLAEALNFFNNQIGDEGLVHVASLLKEREARRALERQRHELRFEQARIEERLVDHALEARIAQLKGRPAVLDIGGAAEEARVGTPKWWADIETTAAGKAAGKAAEYAHEMLAPAEVLVPESRPASPTSTEERWSDAAAGDLEQLRLVREEAARLERRRPAPPILPRLAKVRVGRNGISHKEMQAFKALCGRLGITCEA